MFVLKFSGIKRHLNNSIEIGSMLFFLSTISFVENIRLGESLDKCYGYSNGRYITIDSVIAIIDI